MAIVEFKGVSRIYKSGDHELKALDNVDMRLEEGKFVVILGPSGAGKSTLAKAIAAKLGILYVDTGAIYRTIGYAVKRRGIEPRDEAAVRAILPELEIGMRYEADGEQHMLLNGQDVTREIRLPEISMYASAVSALPAVRAFLLEMQRDLARKHSVIMDGRDIGTTVFPDAELKIFVTATPEIRAQRRYDELKAKGEEASFDEILENVKQRDYIDQNRDVSPLRKASDALLLDNSHLSISQQKEWLAEQFERVIKEKN